MSTPGRFHLSSKSVSVSYYFQRFLMSSVSTGQSIALSQIGGVTSEYKHETSRQLFVSKGCTFELVISNGSSLEVFKICQLTKTSSVQYSNIANTLYSCMFGYILLVTWGHVLFVYAVMKATMKNVISQFIGCDQQVRAEQIK